MPSPSPWVFITTTPSRTRPTSDQRSEIHRQAMREIGVSRRAPPRRAKRLPYPQQDGSVSVESYSDSNDSLTPIPWPAPIALIAPSPLDGDSRILFQHMFSDALPSQFRSYRDRWYPICIAHLGAFNQMLSTYAMHLLLWRQTSVNNLRCLVLTHHLKALAAVRRGILSTLGGPACEEMLCTIVALACYAHLQGDLRSWKQHMSIINIIIEQSSLSWADLNPEIQNLIQWVDCIGSYALDLTPTVNIESGNGRLIVGYPPARNPTAISTRVAGLCPDMRGAFDMLESINMHIELVYAQECESIWQRPGEVDALVHPVTRKFLTLSRVSGGKSPAWICLRSGALLYLAEFRRLSGISPVVATMHLQQLWQGWKECWSLDPGMRLWLWTVGAIEGYGHPEAEIFNRVLEETLLEMKIGSTIEWQASLREILWLDVLFSHKILSISHVLRDFD